MKSSNKLNVVMMVLVIAFASTFAAVPANVMGESVVASATTSNTETLQLTAIGIHPLQPIAKDAAYDDMWDMIDTINAMLGPNQSITGMVITSESFASGTYTIRFEIDITTFGPPGA